MKELCDICPSLLLTYNILQQHDEWHKSSDSIKLPWVKGIWVNLLPNWPPILFLHSYWKVHAVHHLKNCYDSLLCCVISRCTRRELRSAKPDGHGFRQRALPSPSQEAEACEEESQAPELRIPRQSLQPFIWTRDLPWPPLRHLVWIQCLRTHSNSSSIESPTTALKLLCCTLLRAAILRGLRRLQAIQQIQRLLKPFWINVNNLTQYPQGWCSRCSLKLWAICLGLLFSTWLIQRQDLSQVLEVNYHPWSRRVSNSVDIGTVLKWNRVD